MRTLSLFEHGYPEPGSEVVSDHQLRALQKLQDKGKTLLEVYGSTIKATSFVGVIQLPGITIEILPKLYREDTGKKTQARSNLLHLLQYTRRLFRNIRESEVASLFHRKTNFFEVLVYLFVSHLAEIVKRGIHRSYVNIVEDSRFLKGTWLLEEQMSKAPHSMSTFLIQHDDFTEDNLLNRILKYALRLLMTISGDELNKRMIRKTVLTFADVEDLPRVSPSTLSEVTFTRLNDEYKPVFELARLLISGLSIDLSVGRTQTYAFVFDMNVLFEEFVVEFVKQEHVLADSPYNDCLVRSQSGTKHLMRSGEQEFINLRPDIRFERLTDTCCILDTKYKLLSDKMSEGIVDADAYQMYAYADRYACPRVIMLYPEHSSIRKVRKVYDIMNNKTLEVHTLDIRRDFSQASARHALREELKDILLMGRQHDSERTFP